MQCSFIRSCINAVILRYLFNMRGCCAEPLPGQWSRQGKPETLELGESP